MQLIPLQAVAKATAEAIATVSFHAYKRHDLWHSMGLLRCDAALFVMPSERK